MQSHLKRIWTSKNCKTPQVRPLLEVELLKKWTPLWRKARSEFKTYKTPQVRSTFASSDIQKVHALAARSTSRSENAIYIYIIYIYIYIYIYKL